MILGGPEIRLQWFRHLMVQSRLPCVLQYRLDLFLDFMLQMKVSNLFQYLCSGSYVMKLTYSLGLEMLPMIKQHCFFLEEQGRIPIANIFRSPSGVVLRNYCEVLLTVMPPDGSTGSLPFSSILIILSAFWSVPVIERLQKIDGLTKNGKRDEEDGCDVSRHLI